MVVRFFSVLFDAIFSEITLLDRGMLLANSSANTVEIASFWSSVNGFAVDDGARIGISTDAVRGFPFDVFGEGC